MLKISSFILLIGLLFCHFVSAQDTTDVVRLRNLSYMDQDLVRRIDCDNITDNLSARICANLAFQDVDKRMNEQLLLHLEQIANDSVRQEVVTYHQAWVAHRRLQSYEASEGYRGHLLGLVYLDHMIRLTEWRLTELLYLNNREK